MKQILLCITLICSLAHAPSHAMQEPKDAGNATSTMAPYIFGAGWALMGLSRAGLKACESYYEYQHDATIKSITVDRRTALHRSLYHRLPEDTIALIKKFDTTDGNALAPADAYKNKAFQAAQAFNHPTPIDTELLPTPCRVLYNTGLIGVGFMVGGMLLEKNGY